MTKITSTSIFNEGGRNSVGDNIDPQPADAQVERPETQPRARRNEADSASNDGSPSEVADAFPESTTDGHVIVGAEIHLREGAALLCDCVEMADTRELEAALKLSRKAFEAARDKIAKRTQVSSTVLKVMAGIHSDFLKLSVVIEQRHMSQELMDEFEVVSAEITASLRSALTSAGAMRAPKAPGDTDSEPTPNMVSPATVDPNDTVGKRFLEGLLAITRPGSLAVSLVSNGKADGAGTIKLECGGGRPNTVRRRESEAQQMTGFVHNFSRLGKCEFKKEGASARIDAEFATDDVVAMLLRLACDNPSVTVEYHSYKDASDSVLSIQITKLVALSAPWAGVTGAFANLSRAVDALKKLVPKDRKPT